MCPKSIKFHQRIRTWTYRLQNVYHFVQISMRGYFPDPTAEDSGIYRCRTTAESSISTTIEAQTSWNKANITVIRKLAYQWGTKNPLPRPLSPPTISNPTHRSGGQGLGMGLWDGVGSLPVNWALYYFCNMMLPQHFKPMGAHLSMKAALPLAERIATTSDRCINTWSGLEQPYCASPHDDVMTWKRCPHYWPLWEDSIGQWWLLFTQQCGALMCTLILVWTSCWKRVDWPVISNAKALMWPHCNWYLSYFSCQSIHTKIWIVIHF